MRYSSLSEQLNGEYRPMNFTIYNFADEDGWITEISNRHGEKYGIDDFVYLNLSITDEDSSSLKRGVQPVLQRFKEFKRYIEHEVQETPELAIFIIKDCGCVVSVKLKDSEIKLF